MKILYLVHDVTDPAVARRVRMLTTGGAEVVVAGFRRVSEAISHLAGSPVVDLGRSHDAKLASRAALVFRRFFSFRNDVRHPSGFDLVIARNLEMLVLAQRFRKGPGRKSLPVVYECLDIHRLMLGKGAVSIGLRRLERMLLKRSAAVIVSSPAFSRQYFHTLQRVFIPELLVENKAEVDRHSAESARTSVRHLGPEAVIRIGWFGMIRCRRSFDFLAGLAATGRVLVIIGGRPTPAVFPDFERLVAGAPNVRFIGAYRASDLASLYADVDFAWAIDFYEEGLNSNWLLPNRLYESVACGAVPIALSFTETGKYLLGREIGLVKDDLECIRVALDEMTSEEIISLGDRVRRSALADFIQSDDGAGSLVRALSTMLPRSVTGEESPK